MQRFNASNGLSVSFVCRAFNASYFKVQNRDGRYTEAQLMDGGDISFYSGDFTIEQITTAIGDYQRREAADYQQWRKDNAELLGIA